MAPGLGIVLGNRPWPLVPGLKSALVAALTKGAIATINSTVWLLAGSLSWWSLGIATIVSIALVVGWLVIDGELWDRPDDSARAQERSRLYNTSTTGGYLGTSLSYADLFVLNWFVASAATVAMRSEAAWSRTRRCAPLRTPSVRSSASRGSPANGRETSDVPFAP